jgi:hypothetical protein
MVRDQVRADALGVDLTLGPAESKIERVGVLAARSAGEGSIGVSVKGERSGGALVRIHDATIHGFRVGVGLGRGGRADIRRSWISDSSYGIMGEGANADIEENAIGADHFGVYLSSGTAQVDRNRIYDVTAPIGGVFGEPSAGIMLGVNLLYMREGCEHFHWDNHFYCMPMAALPGGLRDASGFDADRAGPWEADGYEGGYMRDGPVAAFDPHAPKRRGGPGGPGGFGGGGFGGGGGGAGGGPPAGFGSPRQ